MCADDYLVKIEAYPVKSKPLCVSIRNVVIGETLILRSTSAYVNGEGRSHLYSKFFCIHTPNYIVNVRCG